MLDFFFSVSQIDLADFAYSLRMMLVKEGAIKEKKGLDFFLIFFEKSCLCVKIACSDSVRRLYGLCAL